MSEVWFAAGYNLRPELQTPIGISKIIAVSREHYVSILICRFETSEEKGMLFKPPHTDVKYESLMFEKRRKNTSFLSISCSNLFSCSIRTILLIVCLISGIFFKCFFA